MVGVSMQSRTQFQPLYQQVYEQIVELLSEGQWRSGEALPSEFKLAEQLKVSQGTVRKALNQLVAKNVLERKQGKGTYLAEHAQESAMYRFFRYRKIGSEGSVIPDTKELSMSVREATDEEQESFGLSNNIKVNELVRLRFLDDTPAIYEEIVQPLAIFPNIDTFKELPNALYSFYQNEYHISVVEVQDEICAVQLSKEIADHLELSEGSAALMTCRRSFSIRGKVVEISQAYCGDKKFVYSNTLK